MRYKLKTPVELGTETLTEVTVQKPKGKHLKKMPLSPETFEDLLPVAAALLGQPTAFFDQLAPEDYLEIQKIVFDFLPQ